jgi:hypothetical protein
MQEILCFSAILGHPKIGIRHIMHIYPGTAAMQQHIYYDIKHLSSYNTLHFIGKSNKNITEDSRLPYLMYKFHFRYSYKHVDSLP